MRYSEISKALTELAVPDTRKQATDILVRAGYKLLGSGGGGSVFQKPGASYVLKLYDTKDEGYADFVSLAMKHPNPHFPKFFGKPVKVTQNYYAVRTELLQPRTGRDNEVEMIDAYVIHRSTRWPDDTDFSPEQLKAAYEFVKQNPKLHEACDLLAGIIRVDPVTYVCDIQGDNVMVRGSTLVITDPIQTYTDD